MMNLIIASGYFNPLSYHHLDYLKSAKHLFDTPTQNELVIILNNDKQVKLKNSVPFQDEDTRLKILNAIKYVYNTYLSIDNDDSISETIESIYNIYKDDYNNNFYFVNGGPRIVSSKEVDICNRLGIKCMYGIGGQKKVESSSWIIERAAKEWLRRKLELDL